MPYRPPKFTQTQETEQRVPPGFSGDFIKDDRPKQQTPKRVKRRKRIKSLDMRLAYLFSTVLHVALPIFLLFAVILLELFGFNPFLLFHTPKPKQPTDLVFVLTPPNQKEEKPLNPNTHYRAIKDMRAGGKHNPNKPVIIAHPAPSTPKKLVQAHPQPKPTVNHIKQTKPTPPRLLVTHPSHQKPLKQVKPQLTKPMPISKPIEKSESTENTSAPIVHQTYHQSSSPAPIMTKGGPSGLQTALSKASPGTVGAEMNPSPGNTNHTPGVDAKREPDFGPYMQELQRRIKEAWQPPRGNESKRIVVVFKVDRQGRLIDVKISHSSGEQNADQAALLAIKQAFPFKPLPAEYTEKNIDIEFTFDYNVFGDKQRLERQAQQNG